MFAKWREDTPQTIVECLEHDFHYWKVERFVKDETDYKNVKKLCVKHYLDIKELFVCLVANSDQYPSITELAFLAFCKQANVFD